MKIHRFYTPDITLSHDFWFKQNATLNQWIKVLRFQPSQQVVLFDGKGEEKLYTITEIHKDEAHLEYITDYTPKVPQKNIYLFWSLLKKDKNDWVLQKCTELGVSHFIPLLADRSEKTGFNMERAQKIVIEAAEQCGRSDIPNIRDVMHVRKAVEEYTNKVTLYVCDQDNGISGSWPDDLGLLIGPEGGWSEAEKQLFADSKFPHIGLHNFTLRAETACVAAVTRVLL